MELAPPVPYAGRSSRPDWTEGARVLTFWEEEWLYPGVIRCIDDDVAFIKFDDGDRALRLLDDLEPVHIQRGDVVHGRRDKSEKRYYPATVLAVEGEEIELRYEDGLKQRTTVSYLRFPRSEY
jgi:hypothetical protein